MIEIEGFESITNIIVLHISFQLNNLAKILFKAFKVLNQILFQFKVL